MIERTEHLRSLRDLLRQFPVVAIIGPRQVGKTTLARELVASHRGKAAVFDLESAEDLAQLQEPLLHLRPLRGLVVLDEVQRRPGLFETIRVLVDEPGAKRRFLVLGSASPPLLQQSSETLAGRIAYHELPGFTLDEVGPAAWAKLWRRGGFPPSFLARNEADSLRWRNAMIRTYLERDIPALGLRLPAPALRRFWTMLAHYHGQLWNSSELARSFGVSHKTVQHYLDILTETFMVRQLLPWHENIGKRQVKAPRIYIRDSGVLHALLGLAGPDNIESHPKVGASWEGYALDSVVARLGARPEECFFWRTHTGAELDLLVIRGRMRLGFEFKRTSAPTLTRSMHTALDDLALDRLFLVHAGRHTFDLKPPVRALAFGRILEDLEPLR